MKTLRYDMNGYVKETSAIQIVGVVVVDVAEAASVSSSKYNHFPFRETQNNQFSFTFIHPINPVVFFF